MFWSAASVAAIAIILGFTEKLVYSTVVNIISDWLTDRQKAFFKHYKEKHPERSPRVCLFGWCVLIPQPKRKRR